MVNYKLLMHFVELPTEAQEKIVIIFEDRMVHLDKYEKCHLQKNGILRHQSIIRPYCENWEVTKSP